MARTKKEREIIKSIVSIADENNNLDSQILAEKIGESLVSSLRKRYDGVVCYEINVRKNIFRIYAKQYVVEEVENPEEEISLEDARAVQSDICIGDELITEIDTLECARSIASSAKNTISAAIREAKTESLLAQYEAHKGGLATAEVVRFYPETGDYALKINNCDVTLYAKNAIPGEILDEGEKIKVYVVDADSTEAGKPVIRISRNSPELVRRLFEEIVPECISGEVEVVKVSRQAGARSKVAVRSINENIDPVGACIGEGGARLKSITEQLGKHVDEKTGELTEEKIDLIPYSDDPETFIRAAMKPAEVIKDGNSVKGFTIRSLSEHSCEIRVPDDKLSLAIGIKGQNVRLAARLTGWKIDIKPESGFYGESKE